MQVATVVDDKYEPTKSSSSYDNIHSAMETVEVATPLVDITAPAKMPAGYKFEAQINGKMFQVTVPEGGVEKGQNFSVSLPHEDEEIGAPSTLKGNGRFKDDLFSCFRYGFCHPSCCMPTWPGIGTPFCALGQVMTRLGLTWLANSGPPVEVSQTFRNLFILGTFYAVFSHIGSIFAIHALLIQIFFFYISFKVRQHIRNRDNIPAENCCPTCQPCEDFWITCCCTCCSISQMMRHTADYDQDLPDCCSKTGFSGNADLRRENKVHANATTV